ncbi:histidine kinase [Clostridium thermosuccinogenes]|uniref:Histidine kinase n=1 Tax=Clostridium thermosuccinogenes TaxID=84032 RepID=A0A2K2FER8_9CLOT|nr:sensor histidine kinase [Pseudoclostridium thermosuccinogenes]AUS95318.1 histidine kinase [Pseudoclostridium thermosuccinogenes]PNT97283.1 histidine kinase [Pseudoclostridium thermosuccinogenes]PNT99260.1 histidine kinase [Pseudoclostridium thermosuccinogenes]
MIATIIEFSRYWAALLFGMVVAVSFVGMPSTRKKHLVLGCYTVAVFVIQVLCLFRFGMDITWKIYPLLTHFPIAAFLALYLKRSWLISVTSMFATFLCCQPPRWIGSVAADIFGDMTGGAFSKASINHLGYILSVILMYYILKKYVAKSVQHLMERSTKSCLIFGAVPAFYYLVDYSTTVYTDFLYSGTRAAVQFMPFIISAFYFVFVIFYYIEMQKQAEVERERDMLDTQFRLAQAEFASLRQMHQNAAAYRHDMRHHFALLQGLASDNRMEEIKEYLRTAQSDMDAITPIRYCENETVNLILSAFATKAKQSEISLSIDAKLPDSLSLSDTELCSLLSNALENAIQASKKIADSNERIIKLRIYLKNNKLCIDIRNSYHTEPVFVQGIPVSKEQGHGFGTKSMVHIVEKHGGVCQFSVKDGWFIFQATI